MGFTLIGLLVVPGLAGSVTWQEVWKDEEPGHLPCKGLLGQEENHARLSNQGSAWLYGYLTAHGYFYGHGTSEFPRPPTQYSCEIVRQCSSHSIRIF